MSDQIGDRPTGTTESFHQLVSEIDYPMFIVTAASGAERAGCLVGFATQASIDPARLLVLLSKANHTWTVAQRAGTLTIHFLDRGNRDLAALFGEQTGDQVDKFSACRWVEGPFGTPVLEGTRGWVAGPILARWDAGDHLAHLVAVEVAEVDEQARGGAGNALTFQAVRGLTPGHPA